jgi:hypothetical protein
VTEGEYLWPSREAVLQLNRLLDLPATGQEQDWEVELADTRRVDEWLELLRQGALSLDARSALALLILHSLPTGADDDPNDPLPKITTQEAHSIESMQAALLADSSVRTRLLSYCTHFGMTSDSPVIRTILAIDDPRA